VIVRRDPRQKYAGPPWSHSNALEHKLADLRLHLLSHPIYREVRSVARLGRFMEAHVFAVWDFMSLAKRLQRDLTSFEIPWVPPRRSEAACFLNEIILSERDAGPMGRRAMIILLGVLTVGILSAALSFVRVRRGCGHLQPLAVFLVSKMGMGHRSHEEAEAAAGWIKAHRRERGDFELIRSHLAPALGGELPASHLRSMLGEPDQRRLNNEQGDQEDWVYNLDKSGREYVWCTIDLKRDIVVDYWSAGKRHVR
jgi:hypothetical protein